VDIKHSPWAKLRLPARREAGAEPRAALDSLVPRTPAVPMSSESPLQLPTPREQGNHPLRQDPPPLPPQMSVETGYSRSVPYLLLPPDQQEMYRYRKRYKWLLIIPSLVSMTGICVSQVKFAALAPWLWWLLPYSLFTLLYYLVSLCIMLRTPSFDMQKHRAFIEQWKRDRFADGRWPSIDILLPICGEPVAVLRNTWKLVLEMCKRYPGRCQVYILDDGASPEAKMAAELFRYVGFQYVVRPNRGVMKKAGNLRFGFEHSRGEAILILDADFCPHRDMLFHLLSYMWADPTVGIVQSPQFFRTTSRQNWLARGAGAVQELFYRYIQVGRNYHKGAICVGSCALYRRAAIASIGGPYQIEHSEDVWTGVMCYSKGWRLQYIPVNIAVGLCPAEYTSFVRQQYRWCRGSMSLFSSKRFWGTKMPLMTRLCYMSGFFYYCHTALAIFVLPLLPTLLIALLPQQIRIENYLLLLPSLVYSFLIFPLWHTCDYRLDSGFLDAMAVKLVYSWAHAFTIFDLLRGRPLGWKPTGSSTATGRTHWHVRHARLLLFLWGSLSGSVWVGGCVLRIIGSPAPWNFWPILCLGIFHLLVVLRASTGAREGGKQ
jgi:cellulose synthase (UDP-forming)